MTQEAAYHDARSCLPGYRRLPSRTQEAALDARSCLPGHRKLPTWTSPCGKVPPSGFELSSSRVRLVCTATSDGRVPDSMLPAKFADVIDGRVLKISGSILPCSQCEISGHHRRQGAEELNPNRGILPCRHCKVHGCQSSVLLLQFNGQDEECCRHAASGVLTGRKRRLQQMYRQGAKGGCQLSPLFSSRVLGQRVHH